MDIKQDSIMLMQLDSRGEFKYRKDLEKSVLISKDKKFPAGLLKSSCRTPATSLRIGGCQCQTAASSVSPNRINVHSKNFHFAKRTGGRGGTSDAVLLDNQNKESSRGFLLFWSIFARQHNADAI